MMPATYPKVVEEAVCERYPIDEALQRLINQANYDVYFGPGCPEDNYPGWSEALNQIEKAMEDVSDLWVDGNSGGFSDREPDGGYYDEETGEWIEEDLSEWWHAERSDVLRILLGKELPGYL